MHVPNFLLLFIAHFRRRKLNYDVVSLITHCVKSVEIRSFSGPYFPVFGLNTEICGVISAFSPNTGKYGSEKTPYLDTFHTLPTLQTHVRCRK